MVLLVLLLLEVFFSSVVVLLVLLLLEVFFCSETNHLNSSKQSKAKQHGSFLKNRSEKKSGSSFETSMVRFWRTASWRTASWRTAQKRRAVLETSSSCCRSSSEEPLRKEERFFSETKTFVVLLFRGVLFFCCGSSFPRCSSVQKRTIIFSFLETSSSSRTPFVSKKPNSQLTTNNYGTTNYGTTNWQLFVSRKRRNTNWQQEKKTTYNFLFQKKRRTRKFLFFCFKNGLFPKKKK